MMHRIQWRSAVETRRKILRSLGAKYWEFGEHNTLMEEWKGDGEKFWSLLGTKRFQTMEYFAQKTMPLS